MSQMGKFISAASLGVVDSLTGDVGGAVSPDGVGNINLLGTAGQIVTTGAPGANSITFSIDNGTDGQLLIGGGTAATWGNISSASGTIVITNGANTIDLNTSGIVAVSFDEDVGTATPALGVLTVAGGTNINTFGAASTATINLDAAISGMTSVDFSTGGRIGTDTSAGDTYLLQAYDVDGASYTTFATLTANNTPTMDLDDTVTKSGSYIYRAGGTDVPVTDGGTGLSLITDHSLIVGSGAATVTELGVATDGQLVIGSSGLDPALGDLTSTNGTIDITAGAGTLDVEAGTGLLIMTGFESWGGAGNYFDDTTIGQFTVSRPGTGYINGEPVSWTAPQTEVGLTSGNTYYIFMDSTGTIGSTTTYSESLFNNNIVLFEVMRDSTLATNIQVTVKENHPYQYPWRTSTWAHSAIGTVISGMSGGANITLNGTQKIDISGADDLEDHGLETIIPDSGGVAETWEQYLTNGSGKWIRSAQSDTFDGTWNNAGTATALSANKFSTYRLYVSKDNITSSTPIYFAVLDDAEYNNLGAAQTAIANGTPTATAELAALEIAQLGFIIFSEASTSIVDVIIAKETVRTSFSGATSTTASLVLTNVTNFDGILSSSDTNVQSALETIDDWGKFTEVTGTTVAMAVNRGYILNNAGLVTATLPATATVGDVIEIRGKGAGGWLIAQNAGQTIHFISQDTTTGAGGSIASIVRYDNLTLTCLTANTDFTISGPAGNFTVV